MPLPPLRDPSSLLERAAALSKAIPTTGFLFSSLIGVNAAQTASLVLLPISPKTFRAFQRLAAGTWWGWCVTVGKLINGITIEVTGDDVPMRENAIVVLNHQDMADITFLMIYARSKDRLGDMKWMVKDVIKYVPGVGWGMLFLDCIFVKRDWTKDRESVRRTFARLRDNQVPVWMLSFSEGTRINPEKLEKSRAYARKQGLPEPRHVLLPRTKGFVATVEGLRDHVSAVYDVTVGYEEGVPNLWQYIKGYAKRAHLHVRRYPIDELPTSDEELGEWISERFREKDELLEGFYATGAFPA
jgi:1-acyl-sn-glycerol-3-phosphate acyltransferase